MISKLCYNIFREKEAKQMKDFDVYIKAKIQNIYYQTPQDDLGIARATKEDNVKITLAEAQDILLDREIEYKEVLRVKNEWHHLEIPINELEDYIVTYKKN